MIGKYPKFLVPEPLFTLEICNMAKGVVVYIAGALNGTEIRGFSNGLG